MSQLDGGSADSYNVNPRGGHPGGTPEGGQSGPTGLGDPPPEMGGYGQTISPANWASDPTANPTGHRTPSDTPRMATEGEMITGGKMVTGGWPAHYENRRAGPPRPSPEARHAPREVDEVTVYTSSNNGEALRAAVLAVLEVCGFDFVGQDYPQRGSWYQRIFIHRRDPQARDNLRRLAGKVERAAELRYISAPRSESDEREANAIACLAQAMAAVDEVVIRTSSVLFIKTQGRVLAWVLTEEEVRVLNENPHLMKSPLQILDALSGIRQPAQESAPQNGRQTLSTSRSEMASAAQEGGRDEP